VKRPESMRGVRVSECVTFAPHVSAAARRALPSMPVLTFAGAAGTVP
jgi:hypothetical protein